MLTYVYIASPSYSGSTLLSFLLATHPQISSIGELTGPGTTENGDTYRCSCGALLPSCNLWESVIQRMNAVGIDFSPEEFGTRTQYDAGFISKLFDLPLGHSALDLARDRLIPKGRLRRHHAIKAAERCNAIAGAITWHDGSTIFVDASKYYGQIRHLSRTVDEFRVIHLIRDGRAVMNSYVAHAMGSAERGAAAWVKDHRRIERAARAYLRPGQYMRLHYEALCSEPVKALAGVSEFVGVQPSYKMRHINPKEFHVIGNNMRLQPIEGVVLDDTWRLSLTASQLAAFSRAAGNLNARYGYSQA